MRPQVGEEMSRQPSLPSLTIEGTLVRTSRLTRAEHHNTQPCGHNQHRIDRARPDQPTTPRLRRHLQPTHRRTHLTRPRSFRDA